jgi:hypothetical protein
MMSTYDRIKSVLDDGNWHTLDELRAVSAYPERWIEEFRRDGITVIEIGEKVAIATTPDATRN